MQQITQHKKILAIQFKYLGDAVFITPALLAIKEQFPDAELHVLVAKEVAPILINISWITKVWAMPRTRGKLNFFETWPFVMSLRNENFERLVDLGGNDRAAVVSFLIGAKIRTAPVNSKKQLLKRVAFTQLIEAKSLPTPWVSRHLKLLSLAWNTPEPSSPHLSITSNPALADDAKKLLRSQTILCHVGASQSKKEWPIQNWIDLYKQATQKGYYLAFSAGTSNREQAIITEIKSRIPNANILPRINDLNLFLAVLNEAELVIAGDTGPLHFAAGLGIKILGLFACDNSIQEAAPNYQKHEYISSSPCTCIGKLAHFEACQSKKSCMSQISVGAVMTQLVSMNNKT